MTHIADIVTRQGIEHRTEVCNLFGNGRIGETTPGFAIASKRKTQYVYASGGQALGQCYNKGTILIARHAMPQNRDLSRAIRAGVKTVVQLFTGRIYNLCKHDYILRETCRI